MKTHLNLANSIGKIMHIVIKQLLVEELGSLRSHGYCILSLLTLFAIAPFEFWYHNGAKERCNFKRFIDSYFFKFIPNSILKSALSTEHSACTKWVILDGAFYCRKYVFISMCDLRGHDHGNMVAPWKHQWFPTYFAQNICYNNVENIYSACTK